MVKDEDGAPNWAATAKKENKAQTKEKKGKESDEEAEKGEKPGAGDLNRQLEQLEIK